MPCGTMHQQQGWRCLGKQRGLGGFAGQQWHGLGCAPVCWSTSASGECTGDVQLPVRAGFPRGDSAGRECEHICGVTGAPVTFLLLPRVGQTKAGLVSFREKF